MELNNFNLDNPHEIQIAFDKFFKERKDTLKSFILSQSTYDEDNINILRNLSLCENLEELSTDNHDYVLTQLLKIAKMLQVTYAKIYHLHLWEVSRSAEITLLSVTP